MTPIPETRRRGIGPGLALIALGIVATSVACSRSRPDPDQLLAQAVSEHGSGRVREARDTLARLETIRPPTPADRLIRAQVERTLGHDALPELALIPVDDPLAPAARLLAGRIEVSRGRLRLAEAHFLASVARDPDNPQPRRELAYIYALQHRLRELDGQFVALSDRNQLDDQSLMIWARVQCGIWNPTEDLKPLQKALDADPDDRDSRLALAEAALLSKRIDEAQELLAPLPEADPEARIHRFSIAVARGDWDAAESLLAGAEGSPDHPRLLQLRGMLALSRQDAPGAVKDFRAALALKPTDRASQSGLGTALKLSGRAEEAGPYLEAARRQDAVAALVRVAALAEGNRDPTLPCQIGIACALADRKDEAKAWLKLAIRRDPLDAEAQQALYRLEHPTDAGLPASK